METYKIEPGKNIELHITQGFYSAQAMISIKALGMTENSSKRFRFQVTYLNANGNSVGFPMLIEPPYFFDSGTWRGENFNTSPGPFYFVQITSDKSNSPLVIQVGFTNRLA